MQKGKKKRECRLEVDDVISTYGFVDLSFFSSSLEQND